VVTFLSVCAVVRSLSTDSVGLSLLLDNLWILEGIEHADGNVVQPPTSRWPVCSYS
jgi:hypothetical protein